MVEINRMAEVITNGVNGGQAGGEFKPDVSSTVSISAQSRI